MSDRPDPTQPEPSATQPREEHQEHEEQMRRFPMRDRLMQLFYWLYPYAAGRERERNKERK